MTPIATNLYYTYSASSELIQLPKAVHTAFSIIGMYTCLDFFPAQRRLEREIQACARAITPIIKVEKIALMISECSSMCVDVIWFFDELRKFTPLVNVKFVWADTAYKILYPLQPLWLLDSIHKTFFSNKKVKIIDAASLASNVVYYSASYISYVVRPTSIIPSVQLACCLSSLAITIYSSATN